MWRFLVALLLLTSGCAAIRGYKPERTDHLYLLEQDGRLAFHKNGETIQIDDDLSPLVACSSIAVALAQIATERFRAGQYRLGTEMVVDAVHAHETDSTCTATTTYDPTALEWFYQGKLRLRRGSDEIDDANALVEAVDGVAEAAQIALRTAGDEQFADGLFWSSVLAGTIAAVGLTGAAVAENSNQDHRTARYVSYGALVVGGAIGVASAIMGSWYASEARSGWYDATNAFNDARAGE